MDDVRISVYTYTYDTSGTGLLQSSTSNGNTFWFFWDGYTPSLLTFGSQASTSAALLSYFNHSWELGGTVCHFDLGTDFELNSGDDAVFYLYDEAGNIIALADDTGALLHTFEQDAWGNDLGGTFDNLLGVEQHQTGKFLDSDTGLYYFGARWYDPSLGRFISESPISPFAEEEYAYCHNSPVNYVDLNGLNPVDTISEYWNRSREAGVDIDRHLDSETAQNLYYGINTGAECALLLATPGPDELFAIGIAIRYKRLITKLPLIGKFFIKTSDDILANAKFIRETLGKSPQYSRGGGFKQALDDFYSMNPQDVQTFVGNTIRGMRGKTPNGETIIVRTGSSAAGLPTLEIHRSRNKIPKIRYHE